MSDTGLLLPSSATALERDLSASSNPLPRVGPAAELIRTAKRENIPDSVVPFLIYEYGLGELLPYLSDPRTAIATGVLWQRLRGTPQSFRIALGWIGNDGIIEESEGGTSRWSQFQLGLASAPVDLSQTDSVVEIGRLSSPVRSSLFRIYGGWYDGRRFNLDDHKLSGLDTLCDHTGVYLKSEWPQLSFGREFKDEQGDISGDLAGALGIHRNTAINGLYEDRTYLSNSVLGETSWRTLHIEDLSSVISRLHFSVVGPFWKRTTTWDVPYSWGQTFDWADLQNKFTPALKFARAGLYLSDYADLGDTNACFPCTELSEFGDGPMVLSEGNLDTGEGILSEHISRVELVEINERFERNTDAEQTHIGSVHQMGDGAELSLKREHKRIFSYDDSFELSRSRLSEFVPIPNISSNTRSHTTAEAVELSQGYQWRFNNQTWDSATWDGDDGWFETNFTEVDTWANTFSWTNYPQLEQVLGFSRTMLTLSENGHLSDSDGILGDTHATLGHFEDERIERSHGTTSTAHNPSGFFYLHRERFATLAYDDLFELSRTRLSEHIPLFNEQAITREHGSAATWHTEQFDRWADTSPAWSEPGNDWSFPGWFDADNEPSWREAYTWQRFPQLERISNHYTTHLYLSDTDDGLGGTNATLGYNLSQRFDRLHFAQATENRQSFTTRQHTRSVFVAISRFEEPGWQSGDWAGPDATDWVDTTFDWASGSWASVDWIDQATITWANQTMWGKIARWQIASLVVEAVHETHT
tara:strand:- start:17255 stop:19528 length:2274 start_codon:yes stop_codon:yes gene_type:complete